MLTEQTDLTMKFTILDFPLKSYQHKHKDISHLKDYLPEEQKNPWEEKGILQTATEIGQKKQRPSYINATTKLPVKTFYW